MAIYPSLTYAAPQIFTQALFYLAANRQYIQPLREEVEEIVEKDGWTEIAVRKMRKVDSFLKECMRMEGLQISNCSHFRFHMTGILTVLLISNRITQGFERFYILGWNLHTKRNIGCRGHAVSALRREIL